MPWRAVVTDADIATATPEPVDGTAAAVGTSDKYAREDHVHALGPAVANLNMASHRILNVTDPSGAQDAATKAYVDANSSGLTIKDAVRVATAAALPANTRSGDVLTADANGSINGTGIDGITDLALNDRVLVKNETNQVNNGIYYVSQIGDGSNPWTLTRTTDCDEDAEVVSGLFAFVEEGTVNAGSGWTISTANPITVNTTSIQFTQFSGAGLIDAGDGLAKVGSTLSVNVDDSSIEISGDTIQVKAGGITNAMLAGSVQLSKLESLTPAQIIVGATGTGVPTAVAMSGDVTIDGAGATTIGAGAVTFSMLAGNIPDSKLDQIGTANKVALSALDLDGATELGGAIQDGDILVIDDGASGTNRKLLASRIKTYVEGIALSAFAAPSAEMDFAEQEIEGLRPKSYTTAGRPAGLTTEYGVLIYDTDLDRPMVWAAS